MKVTREVEEVVERLRTLKARVEKANSDGDYETVSNVGGTFIRVRHNFISANDLTFSKSTLARADEIRWNVQQEREALLRSLDLYP